ncbi:MAG: PilZ domain-containing protein [Deltaproteobacteria bacterium]|nr:PilZ domain-containing protein [Deltaproteobacteria bacterium]
MTQKRKYQRIDFETDVTIHLAGQQMSGTTLNLSQGGVLLQTSSPLEFGQKLAIEIRIPKIDHPCNIPCVVRWRRDTSVGVQFETLRAIEVWGINQLINTQK